MRKYVIISSLIGSAVIFCMVIDVFDSLFMFLLFGMIPGVDTPLTPQQMLLLYALIATTTTFALSRNVLFSKLRAHASTPQA
jgi:hypothetical protein